MKTAAILFIFTVEKNKKQDQDLQWSFAPGVNLLKMTLCYSNISQNISCFYWSSIWHSLQS